MSEEAKAGGGGGGFGGFGGFFQKAQQLAAQAVENARPIAEKVKEKTSQIDTSKVREVLQQGGAAAQEVLHNARTAAEPQLAQARALADKQAQHLSKVNAKSLLSPNAQFGVPLEALAERGDDGVPLSAPRVPPLLERMVKRLEESAGEEYVVDGKALFSVAADHAAIRALAKQIDSSANGVNIATLDVHSVAGLLRQWLVELPDPLFTSALYDEVVKAALTEGDASAALKVVVAKLPATQAKTLRKLVPFLARVASKGKLDMPTMCLCFGPILLRPKRRDGALRGLMEDLPTICAAAEKILENSETVFPPEAESGAAVNQTWGGAADFADGSV